MRMFYVLSMLIVHSICFAQDIPIPEGLDDPVIGIGVIDADAAKDMLKQAKRELPTKLGVIIIRVEKYGPAGKSGLAPLDVVTHVNKVPIKTVDEFKKNVSELKPGEKYEFGGYRTLVTPNGKATWKKGSTGLKVMTRREMIFGSMTVQKDDFKDITFHRHADSPAPEDHGKAFFAYIVEPKGKPPYLRLKIQYVGAEWIFVNKYSIKNGDSTVSFSPDYNSVARNVLKGEGIEENYDCVVDDKIKPILTDVATKPGSVLRFEGKNSFSDYKIPAEEAARLEKVLTVFAIMTAN